MDTISVLSTILVNLLTLISILVVIRKEKRRELRESEQRYKELVQTIVAEKDKEYQKEQKVFGKIQEVENTLNNELEILKMNVHFSESQKAVEIEKLRASIENLMILIKGLNDRVSELVQRLNDIEKLTKVVYEFIGYTKGEKNAKRKSQQ